MAEKKSVVIELSTNLRTGVTSLVGAQNVLCPRCGGQRTSVVNGAVKCEEPQCREKNPS